MFLFFGTFSNFFKFENAADRRLISVLFWQAIIINHHQGVIYPFFFASHTPYIPPGDHYPVFLIIFHRGPVFPILF